MKSLFAAPRGGEIRASGRPFGANDGCLTAAFLFETFHFRPGCALRIPGWLTVVLVGLDRFLAGVRPFAFSRRASAAISSCSQPRN